MLTNCQVSLSKICHEWPTNAVVHEYAQYMSELQSYSVMSHIFDNEIHQLVKAHKKVVLTTKWH